MTRDQFEATVRRLETFAASRPAAYHRRVAAFGLLGYGYVVVVLAALVAVLVIAIAAVRLPGFLAAKLALAVLALIVLVVQALWVRLPPPSGRRLLRSEAPKLYALIDEVVASCHAPPPDAILLTDEFNAAITQRPRRAFWRTLHYLIIGLPMLQAVTADEFRAILAHECGHLSAGHGATGAWIYRQRAGWNRLAAALDAEAHWGRVLFLRFFRWYAPHFAAYSFVAAREQEFAADRMSAAVTSCALAAQALVRVALTGRHLERNYWPAVGAMVRSTPTPPDAPYARLQENLRHALFPERGAWLADALNEKTGVADTHPSLADRLSALGVAPILPPPLERSAGDELLEQGGAPLTAQADAQWVAAAQDKWKQHHDEYLAAVAKHAALLTAEAAGALPLAQRRELARLEEAVGDRARALERHEALLAELADDAAANFTVGRLRLARGDVSGADLLRRAMSLDREATPAVTMVLAPWLRARGEKAELNDLLDRYDAFQAGARRAQRPPARSRWARRHSAAAGALALIAVVASVAGLFRSTPRSDTGETHYTRPQPAFVRAEIATFWGITLGQTRADVERAKGPPLRYADDVAFYGAGSPGNDATIEVRYQSAAPGAEGRVRAVYFVGDQQHAPAELPFVYGLTAQQLDDRFGTPVWSSVPDNDSEYEMFRSGLTAYLWHRQIRRYGIQDYYRER